MRTAIVSYDLKNVKLNDNIRVKLKLASLEGSFTTFEGLNVNSLFPEWVSLRLPDTTLCVSVSNPLVTTQDIANEVINAIESVNAIADKVFVAFITDDYIWNARKRS